MSIDINSLVEVTLNNPDDFLKVRETLTRIGVASKKEKTRMPKAKRSAALWRDFQRKEEESL